MQQCITPPVTKTIAPHTYTTKWDPGGTPDLHERRDHIREIGRNATTTIAKQARKKRRKEDTSQEVTEDIDTNDLKRLRKIKRGAQNSKTNITTKNAVKKK